MGSSSGQPGTLNCLGLYIIENSKKDLTFNETTFGKEFCSLWALEFRTWAH